MLTHFEQKRLPYTKEQMFDLVADVASYKEFAPWCVASRVNKLESDTVFLADLVVGYKLFREKFSSRVMLDKPHEISIEYLQGPLKNLSNIWQFSDDPEGEGCIIDFKVEFEFKNKALQSLANIFFNEVVKRMVSAFETRADQIYSK
ncbi:MAG: type II toxin-antitoxin system RatA family toxin [Pseudomonadota bacterium]